MTEQAATKGTIDSDPGTYGPSKSVETYSKQSDMAAAQLTLARDLRDILTDDSRSRRGATFTAAELALAERQTMVAARNLTVSDLPQSVAKQLKQQGASPDDQLNSSVTPQLAAQRTKLRGASDLLNRAESDSVGEARSLATTTKLTETAFNVQVTRLQTDTQPIDPGTVTFPPTATPDYDTPVAATVAILEAHDAEVTDERVTELQVLGTLPVSTQRELTDFLNAYLTYYRTVQDADGADVQRVRAAQLQLLEAAADLETALNDRDGLASVDAVSTDVLGSPLQIAGVVSIDLSTTDNTYTEDYKLQLDVGGDDTYNNNAGGANASGKSTDVAALIDLGGTDTYNGRNGGGQYVVTDASPSAPDTDVKPSFLVKPLFLPKKGVAAGFLLDAGTGDDTYNAAMHGSNGGGRRGIGFLVDAGGDDIYNGSGEGTNGAGTKRGMGFLLDAGMGDDTYDAGDEGVSNGGAKAGRGFLFDVGGDDTYVGSNGKGHQPLENTDLYPFPIKCSTDPREENIQDTPCQIYFHFPLPLRNIPESGGFLLDGGGSDTYTGSNGGAGTRGGGFLLDAGTSNDTYDGRNGGATGPGASGFLLDMGGSDRYLGSHHTTNGAGRGGMGFLMDGGTGDDTYDATTSGGPPGPRGDQLGPGSLGTNGGGWSGGHGFLVDAGGNDSYIAGSVGTNGGATSGDGDHPQGPPGPFSPTGFLVDAGGDDRYTAGEVGVNGGASRAVGLLYDNSGTDHYTDGRYRCIDCSAIPKGSVGAQIDRGSGKDNRSQAGPPEVLVVDDTAGSGDADCPDASYEAIQPAVNAAEYGDTVRVCTGTYPGNITIDTSNVTLEAADPGQVVLDGEHERRFGVVLAASQTTVTGFTATNFSTQTRPGVVHHGREKVAFLARGPQTTVSNNVIRDSGVGVIASGLYSGAAFQDLPLTASVFDDRKSTVIANNTVTGGTIGIEVSGTGNVRVSRNTVTATQHGISVSVANGVTIHNNTLSGRGVPVSKKQGGIISVASLEITMTGNRVTGFTAPANWQKAGAFKYGYGIKIRSQGGGEDASHTLRNNRMADNKFNLVLRSVPDSAYKHFTISPSNTVNGKPVVYLVGAVGATISSGGIRNLTLDSSVVPNTTLTNTQALGLSETPGLVVCVRCIGVTVRDLEFSHNGYGVLFVKSRGVEVTNVTVHDTVRSIGLRGSPADVTVTNNTVQDANIAINVAHNCDPRRKDFEKTYREITSGSFEICTDPSVLVAHNTITRASRRFNGLAGIGGAITVKGAGVTVRENTISDAQGAGISMRDARALTSPGTGLFGTGIQLSPGLIFPSTVIDNSISDARVGVSTKGTQGTTIGVNTISDTVIGLHTKSSKQGTYRDNTVTNATIGMLVHWSDLDLTARNNSFRQVRWGLDVKFLYQAEPPGAPASHDFGTTNTVNGERIMWVTGAVSRTLDASDANMVVCVRCVDVTIRDMTITDNAHGIVLWDSTSTHVTNVKVTDTLRTGVLIRGGENNTVQDSTIIDSTEPIWVYPIEPQSHPIIDGTVPVDRSNQNLRDLLGPVRIMNNRIAVDDASWPQVRATYYTRPAIWGHFGIALYEPVAATVTGNNVTDNRWGIYQKRGNLSTLRIKNNTVTHARKPKGRGRFGQNLGVDRFSTLGIKVQGNVPESSDESIVIHNNSLTAGTSPPGSMELLYGITVKGNKLPQTVITDNTVQGYQQSVRVGTGWNNTTVSIRRNRLTGAKSASVLISGRAPGDAVEIHQNLLNPLQFGYGVEYISDGLGGGGHMPDGSSGSEGGNMGQGHLPVDATCNRWSAPSGPSSQRMTLVDPITGEPADGNGSAVSHGHIHGRSNVHFHPWLGESPERTCTKALVGTATPTPIPTPTRTPWPTVERGNGTGSGPGQGNGTGSGPGQGNGTGPGPGTATEVGGGVGTSTATARVAATDTPTTTPPPTATPEIIPGFGVAVWLVAFTLLVAVVAARCRD